MPKMSDLSKPRYVGWPTRLQRYQQGPTLIDDVGSRSYAAALHSVSGDSDRSACWEQLFRNIVECA